MRNSTNKKSDYRNEFRGWLRCTNERIAILNYTDYYPELCTMEFQYFWTKQLLYTGFTLMLP